MIDITNQKSGMLTALRESDPYILPNGRKQRTYECVCDCGNKCTVRLNDFKSGKSTSCGCRRKNTIHNIKLKDLTGNVFGKLKVLKYDCTKNGRAVWKCKCECGNIIYVTSTSLTSGNTKSCGCYKSEMVHNRCFEDLSGMKFGHLNVICFDHTTKQNLTYFKCKCDCGTECVVYSQHLKSGHTTSCGHVLSCMEDKVISYLSEHEYRYCHSVIYEDLKYIKNLIFDFSLLDKHNNVLCLIECQGKQHFENVGNFGMLQRDVTDKMKKDYCINNNIPLFEIRYDDDIIESLKKIINKIHANPVPSL